MITNWDLDVQELSVIPAHETQQQQQAREAKIAEIETAIQTLQDAVKNMYEKHTITATKAAKNKDKGVSKGDRARARQKAKFYGALRRQDIQPALAGAEFATVAEIRAARIIPLHRRAPDEIKDFWKAKAISLEVFASFFGHITTAADIRYVGDRNEDHFIANMQ